jgi:hypothetical protein
MPVPNTFGTATAAIPLSQLDANFATPITLGNTAVQLGNTVTTLNNMTLANVTISSGEVTIGNVSVAGNVTLTGGTANGVAYLNGSKVLTTGSALVFDGTNLGLGVTPSAWDSTYKAIQVGARSMFSGIGSEANMANNAYYNSGYKYVATSAAGLYTIDANVHKWYNAASGTAGNAITFTQAMTLDASGNLGITETSPTAKLHISVASAVVDGTKGVKITNPGGTAVMFECGVSGDSFIGTTSGSDFNIRTGNTVRATFDNAGNFVQKGATTAAGIKPTAIANNESITTVNSTTYTINLGTSAKLFWIALGNGDGALVFTSYLSSSITFLGITPTNVAATASPSSAQLGISKNANSHDIVIKTGSALSSTAASWQMGVLSSQVA